MVTNLKENELQMINGGAIKSTVFAVLTGIGVFIIGFCDGLLRKLKSAKRK